MNPRLSVNVMTTKDWDLGQCVDAYARLGIPGIGITRMGLDAYGAKRGIKKIKDAGLHVVSIGGIGPLLPRLAGAPSPQAHLAGMDLAAELRADCLYVMSGPRGELSWEEAAKRFGEALHAIAPAAQERGVRLAVEPVHPMRQELTFINTARDAMDIIGPFDPRIVGYVFDFYHCWWERGVMETIARSAQRMFAVQPSDHKLRTLKAMDRAMVGEGLIPARSMLRAIERGGYQGYYDFEVISDDLAAMGYEVALQRIVRDFDALWESALA